jgi:hypothetical protein
MTLYCVRMAADHPTVPEEIVGIFSASSLDDLWGLINEVCHPAETEYARLPSGGLIWENRGPKVSDLYKWEGNEDEGGYAATLATGAGEVTERLRYAFQDGLAFKSMRELKL